MKFRKEWTGKQQSVPKDFLQNVGKLYNNQFDRERQDASFSVYGAMNPEEVLLCVSLMHSSVLRAVSCYLSMDLSIKEATKCPDLVTQKLKKMVDLAASWFADTFENTSGIQGALRALKNVEDKWEKVDWSGEVIYVKLTRENQTLEQAASRVLGEGD